MYCSISAIDQCWPAGKAAGAAPHVDRGCNERVTYRPAVWKLPAYLTHTAYTRATHALFHGVVREAAVPLRRCLSLVILV